MENEAALATTSYIITGISMLAALAWLGLRVFRAGPRKIEVEDQTSRYALERLQASRGKR